MLMTIGDIARKAGCSREKVHHQVLLHGIQPVQKAGGARLFDEAAAERLAVELAKPRKVGRPRAVVG